MYNQFWYGVIVGAIGMLVLLSKILKDEWSTWLVLRKNFPLWSQALIGSAFVTAFIYIVLIAVKSLMDEPIPVWIWYVLTTCGGFFLLKALIQYLRKHPGGVR